MFRKPDVFPSAGEGRETHAGLDPLEITGESRSSSSILRPTVSQLVCPGVRGQFSFLSTIINFDIFSSVIWDAHTDEKTGL
jgi:hypothetical protein